MKQFLLITAFIYIASHLFAQIPMHQLIPDPKHNNEQMLVGEITFDDIKIMKEYTWFANGTAAYIVDTPIAKKLGNLLPKYDIVVFVGTWCEDTQDLLPKLYTVCKTIKIPNDKIKLFGVDRNKHALNVEHLLYKIEKVPTVILYKGPLEIGRITESLSKENIEEELLFIIQKFEDTNK
jgi:hypothetical protein